MDYHLDRIQMALLLGSGLDEVEVHENHGFVTGTQEDVDLIVAVESGATTFLVLVEAKAATGWTNARLRSKEARLRTIFGGDGANYGGVAPHYLLMSPREPRQIRTDDWPSWMAREGRAQGLELRLPERRRRVIRTDASGRPSAIGRSFRSRTTGRTAPGNSGSSPVASC